MFLSKDRILWLDCLGGIFVGAAVLTFCRLIGTWGGLPVTVVIGMGVANLAYGAYSLFVTTRNPRPQILVAILALSNMAWLAACVLIFCLNWPTITLIGMVHVIGEGIYVAGLGAFEWAWRKELSK